MVIRHKLNDAHHLIVFKSRRVVDGDSLLFSFHLDNENEFIEKMNIVKGPIIHMLSYLVNYMINSYYIFYL